MALNLKWNQAKSKWLKLFVNHKTNETLTFSSIEKDLRRYILTNKSNHKNFILLFPTRNTNILNLKSSILKKAMKLVLESMMFVLVICHSYNLDSQQLVPDFTKLCVPTKKLQAHSVWRKICQSMSSTFCRFKLAQNYAKICQIYSPFAKIYATFAKCCSPKKVSHSVCAKKLCAFVGKIDYRC